MQQVFWKVSGIISFWNQYRIVITQDKRPADSLSALSPINYSLKRGENTHARKKEIYKCEACGNIVEVLEGGGAELVCCGEEMSLFEDKTADEGKEKHVPVVSPLDEKSILVKVGSNPIPWRRNTIFTGSKPLTGSEPAATGSNPDRILKRSSKAWAPT